MENQWNEKLIRELRERVSELLGATQLLSGLVRDQGDEKDAKCLSVMNHSLYRMIRTINHMELCQAEKPVFTPRTLDLAGLCRDLGREVELQAKELGVSFRWELETESLLTVGDRMLILQAVLNLLTNSFQAVGKTGHVVLRCGRNKDRCEITVWDDGPGLRQREEKEQNPLLKEGEGVGYGLPAAYRAAELHGGVLLLENREEGGLRAIFSLPIREPEEKELKSPAPDIYGGFSPLLVEFSPLLAARDFSTEDSVD